MAARIQIRCINKSDRTNPYERILFIGGVNPDGKSWKMSETDAIAYIKNGKYSFYVSRGGTTVDVIIAKSQHGHEYLKTVADGEQPNNLLSLPECP
jgi:hypothetical protein